MLQPELTHSFLQEIKLLLLIPVQYLNTTGLILTGLITDVMLEHVFTFKKRLKSFIGDYIDH